MTTTRSQEPRSAFRAASTAAMSSGTRAGSRAPRTRTAFERPGDLGGVGVLPKPGRELRAHGDDRCGRKSAPSQAPRDWSRSHGPVRMSRAW